MKTIIHIIALFLLWLMAWLAMILMTAQGSQLESRIKSLEELQDSQMRLNQSYSEAWQQQLNLNTSIVDAIK